jgi:hypothetical protein
MTPIAHFSLVVVNEITGWKPYRNGARVVVSEGIKLPLEFAGRFEVYRPAQLGIAVGDRIRVTKKGVTKDRRHKLRNGGIFTVAGFTPRGNLIIDHG